jgi:DNA-directed RNA polymerase subunit M/transcription elongation factor TFIIS
MTLTKILKSESNITINNNKSMLSLTLANITEDCLKKLNFTSFDKRGLEREYLLTYKFKTRNSTDIKLPLLKEATVSINREAGRNELNRYIILPIAYEIEKGIFEFALTHITTNRLQYHYVGMIYDDKLLDICANLDKSNTKINNTTLLSMLYDITFNPYFTAFLLPEQLHPKKWINIVKKKQIRDDAINTQPYSDMYTCSKCHESKFKISEIQLRCADEPTNRICQCMVCFHTFIK